MSDILRCLGTVSWLAFAASFPGDRLMEAPTTQYARSADGTFIAYQVFGHGADLLIAVPWISHLELFWEDPDVGSWLRSLGRFARIIVMDQRGIGLSDRMTQTIDLETKVDDVRAVLDAAGSARATLYGQGVDGGAICAMFAAMYPERAMGLIFWSGETCGGSQADYPWHIEQSEEEWFLQQIAETWGDEETVGPLMKEAGLDSLAVDPQGRRRWARIMRNAASRGDALIYERIFDETDFRSLLPSIHVPSMILQPVGGAGDVGAAEWMASQIIGAELTLLPDQTDFPPYRGPTNANLEAVHSFVSGLHAAEREFDRVLATVLFTDSSEARSEPRSWVIISSASSSNGTTPPSGLRLPDSVERRSTRPAMVSSQRSKGRLGRCDAPKRSSAHLSLWRSRRAGVHAGEVERSPTRWAAWP